MESLNYYGSDGESDSSSNVYVSKKFSASEIDANCEPITMDMSEESSNEHSNEGCNERNDKAELKRRYSKSLSPSPATSYSSDSSEGNKRRKESENLKQETKNRRYGDERRNKHDDDDRDRRRRDDRRGRPRDRDGDRYGNKKYEKKCYHSRSRSSSRGKHKSYRSKNRSRSRSRSHDRYPRRNSPNRPSNRRRSPFYRSRRSRSRSRSRDKPRPKNWKSTSKLKVLEKLGIELKVPTATTEASHAGDNSSANISGQLTPQMLLQKTMEEHMEKVKSATGIALPSYYNPMAINPTKYAEQIQKRRLLWGNKDKQVNKPPPEKINKTESAESKGAGTIWQGATFGGDQDGKMTAKFQRLMGIKNAATAAVPESKGHGSDLIKKQEEMFNSMESQYEVARLATHTHRGVGLGFGTFQPR